MKPKRREKVVTRVYVGKAKNLGELGEEIGRRKSPWLSKELMFR